MSRTDRGTWVEMPDRILCEAAGFGIEQELIDRVSGDGVRHECEPIFGVGQDTVGVDVGFNSLERSVLHSLIVPDFMDCDLAGTVIRGEQEVTGSVGRNVTGIGIQLRGAEVREGACLFMDTESRDLSARAESGIEIVAAL